MARGLIPRLLPGGDTPTDRREAGRAGSRARADTRERAGGRHVVIGGLLNGDELAHRLERAVARADEDQRALALTWISVFESDGRGGRRWPSDSVLHHCAERISAHLTESDALAHLGGSDFAVLASSIEHHTDAVRFAREMLNAFRRPFIGDRAAERVRVAIGVAVHPSDGHQPGRLLHSAQSAAQRAAIAVPERRGRLAFSSPALNSERYRHEQIRTGLADGLAQEEFVLHYQPILRLPGDEVAAVEALIRWEHSELGLVAPDEFISVAERSGQIVDIGKWVIAEACRQARVWQQAELPARMAVNLSPRQLQEPDLTGYVSETLSDTGLHPELLEVELTESMNTEPETAIAVLKQLHALGVHVSIDDFGTGYSSLSYLARFPRDTLKLDRSFIARITHDKDVAAVVGSVILMAHELGVQTVAEGVETEEHLEFLLAHDCDLSQGYLHSPPLPPLEAEVWLREHGIAAPIEASSALHGPPEADDAVLTRSELAVGAATDGAAAAGVATMRPCAPPGRPRTRRQR